MAEPDFVDPNAFDFRCPVWLCILQPGNKVMGGLTTASLPFVIIFTWEGLAEQYRETQPDKAMIDVLKVMDESSLASRLQDLVGVGVRLVAFDDPGKLGPPKKLYDVRQLIESLRGLGDG
jgi:hypothetical protein